MSELLSVMVYVGGFIMAIVWIVFPFTVVGLLKEIVAQLKLVQFELRKLNSSGKRQNQRDLEEWPGQ